MAWHDSNHLGCGFKSCGFGNFWVCEYGKGGNYVGQRPYAAAKRSIMDDGLMERGVPCGSVTCGTNAFCLNGACECNDGFNGDPNVSCNTTNDPLFINGFEVVKGTDDWTVLMDDTAAAAIEYSNPVPSSENVIHWLDSEHYTDVTDNTISVGVIPDQYDNQWGLCVRYKDAINMVCFNYQRIKPKMSVVVTANGAVQNFEMTGWVPYACPAVDPDANDTIPTHMNVDMLNNYFTVSIGGTKLGAVKISGVELNFAGGVALSANGVTTFSELFSRTRKRLVITLIGCLTADQFKAKIASLLGISVNQILSVNVKGCNKRQGNAEVSFTLEGENAVTAEDLSAEMVQMVQTSDPALAQNGLSVQSIAPSTEALSTIPADAVEIVVGEAAVAAGLSAGAIAGIVIGSIAGAALVGAAGVGGVYAYRKIQQNKEKQRDNSSSDIPTEVEVKGTKVEVKSSRDKKTESSEVEVKDTKIEMKPAKPKAAGPNVYDFNPETITSITARAPPRKVKP